jgi:type IV pilus assembly protein PilE
MSSSVSHRLRGSAGFTLIELMVVVAIAAILGTLAVSGYTNSVRKSRRTEARSALLDLASREERYMSTNSKYSATASDLGYTGPFPIVIGSGYYQVALPAVGAATAALPATFSLTATPVAGKGQDKDAACQTFTVDSTGKQTAYNSGAADSTATCWN